MTYYLFENGDVSDANMVLGNFNELTYAILYNRMEQDAAGGTQIDPSIQSDQFCDADGRYNTICTTCTNSYFCTNYYINYCICNMPFTYTATCTTTGTGHCLFGCGTNCVCGCYDYNPYGAGCLCYSSNSCSENLFLCNAFCVMVATVMDVRRCNTCTFVCATLNYDSNSTTLCDSLGSSGATCCFMTCCNSYCYLYNGTDYDYYKDGSYIGTKCITFTPCIIMDFMVRSHCSLAMLYVCINRYLIGNKQVYSNIKNYAAPKNAVILSTNSILPEGNCVRYDIINQAGCTYLSDAEPDKVYNLCASDSCCFYAVIKQCVECNLCPPQCMFGYALKMM